MDQDQRQFAPYGGFFPGYGYPWYGYPYFGYPFRPRLFPFFFLRPFGFFRQEDERNAHYAVHTVERGDTMYEIARKYNIPMTMLVTMNTHIQDPNMLQVGEQVYIPRMYDMDCQRMYMEDRSHS